VLFRASVVGANVFVTTFKPVAPASDPNNDPALNEFKTRDKLGISKLYALDMMSGGMANVAVPCSAGNVCNTDYWWNGKTLSNDVLTAPKLVNRGVDTVNPGGKTALVVSSSSGEVFQVKDLKTMNDTRLLAPKVKVVFWRETY